MPPAIHPLPPSGRHAARLAAAIHIAIPVAVCAALGVFDAAGLEALRWHLTTVTGMLGGILLRRVPSWLTVVAAASLAALLFTAYGPVAPLLYRGLVRHDALPTRPLDAMVVLSARIDADEQLSTQGHDRLITGLELARAGIAPHLVLSRIEATYQGRRVSSDAEQRRLLALLPMPPRVTTIDSVHSTRDEAVRSAAILLPHSRRIAVVTSPSHTRRACATFERLGFQVTCIASASRTLPARALDTLDPAARIEAFEQWLYEVTAFLFYRSRGWVS